MIGSDLREAVSSSEIDSYSLYLFARGYHKYTDQWDTWIGEVLPLERELTNPANKWAVSIRKASETVRHVPFNIAPVVSAFLKRACNKGLVEVTGNWIH